MVVSIGVPVGGREDSFEDSRTISGAAYGSACGGPPPPKEGLWDTGPDAVGASSSCGLGEGFDEGGVRIWPRVDEDSQCDPGLSRKLLGMTGSGEGPEDGSGTFQDPIRLRRASLEC
jgi:hypothetical protein